MKPDQFPAHLTQQDYDDYDAFESMRTRMSKLYRYKHRKCMYPDVITWHEGVDQLQTIIWMAKEHWIEGVELLEEV
jgi:hypothetical protein